MAKGITQDQVHTATDALSPPANGRWSNAFARFAAVGELVAGIGRLVNGAAGQSPVAGSTGGGHGAGLAVVGASLLAAVAAAQQAQTLAEQQGAQIADLTQQRNAALARTSQLEANLAVLSDRLTQRETAATAEREAQAQHVLAVENRAHQEVDRARQETKEVRSQFAIALKEQRSVEQRLRDERDQAINDVVSSQRDAAMERSRADALTQQLAQINDRIARASATPPATKSVRSTKPTRKRKGRTGDDRLS